MRAYVCIRDLFRWCVCLQHQQSVSSVKLACVCECFFSSSFSGVSVQFSSFSSCVARKKRRRRRRLSLIHIIIIIILEKQNAATAIAELVQYGFFFIYYTHICTVIRHAKYSRDQINYTFQKLICVEEEEEKESLSKH